MTNIEKLKALIAQAPEDKQCPNWNNWLYKFGEDFNNGCYPEFMDGAHEKYSERVKTLVLRSWMCTDTIVGFYAHVWRETDELICITYQTARKNDVNIVIEDQQTWKDFKQFVQGMFEEKDYNRPDSLDEKEAGELVEALIYYQNSKCTTVAAKGVTVEVDPNAPKHHEFEVDSVDGELVWKCVHCGEISSLEDFEANIKEYCK